MADMADVDSETPTSEAPDGGSRGVFSTTAGKAVIGLLFVAIFLTVGVPRWLERDDSAGPNAATDFAKLCRQHGGTPQRTPTGGAGGTQDVCTVRYGGTVYRMDAITSTGFDQDTAQFQRQGCQQAAAEQKASGEGGQTYVYHPLTGVCERRP
jgi:hypothetical protein